MLSASSNIVIYRFIHQITACSLYIKKVDAYEKYVSLSTEYPVLSMALWEERQSCHPTFKFWNLILQLELLLFEFVKSIRSGNLQLFINTLMKIAPWVFALDHHRYARSLPVHINEMSRIAQIKITNKWMRKSKGLVKQLDWLKMKQHYRDGYFVVQKFHGYRMNLKVLMRVWTTCGSIMTFPTLFNQFSTKKWKVYCQPWKMLAIRLITTVTILLT